ncbi:MAG: flagellar basal body-associated FliL family protein [Clostridiales bacterium]|nr:flagellar basal body-associated FliL family protein [Clostridiales bacterium]
MKKNLITVIVLALVLANLVLTAILAFTIIPQAKKSNELINQICAAINLDLEGVQRGGTSIPIEDIATYKIEEKFTSNLMDNGDGRQYYAVYGVSLSINTQSKDFKTYAVDETLSGITSKETLIQDAINTVVSSYTIDEFNANGYQDVKDAILVKIQEMFGGSVDFVVGVNFSGVQTEGRSVNR